MRGLRLRRAAAPLFAFVALCTGCAHPADPAALADQTTRGVYDGDYTATTQNFDDALKGQVTRASLGALSDRMHALGVYHGLRDAGSDAQRSRYDFTATFDRGTMLVELRLDADHRIAAYRVSPQSGS